MIIFSDECMLDDNDYGKQWQWCRGKEVPSNMRMDPGPHSVLVWCAIGVNFRTIVVLPRQLLNAESYQKKILNRNVVQLLAAECRRGSVFQQDNARPHCRSALYLGKRGVKVLDWPARSPDLSPVETIWSWLRREVATFDFPLKRYVTPRLQLFQGYVLNFRRRGLKVPILRFSVHHGQVALGDGFFFPFLHQPKKKNRHDAKLGFVRFSFLV